MAIPNADTVQPGEPRQPLTSNEVQVSCPNLCACPVAHALRSVMTTAGADIQPHSSLCCS